MKLKLPRAAFTCWFLLSTIAVCLFIYTALLQQRLQGEDKSPTHAQELDLLISAEPTSEFCAKEEAPLVCAHGGDTSEHPSNTLAAYRAAIGLNVDCVEVDIARTSDGRLVVLHARELASLTGGKYEQVGQLRSEEISALRWPTGEAVATAQQVLDLVLRSVSCVILDVKTHIDADGNDVDVALMASAVVDLVYATRCNACLVWAKSDRIVTDVLALSPGQRTGYVVMNNSAAAHEQRFDDALRLHAPPVVAMHHEMVSPGMLKRVWAAGKKVFAWTANTPSMIAHVLDAGVDAVVTNFPGVVMDAIDKRLSKCGSYDEKDAWRQATEL